MSALSFNPGHDMPVDTFGALLMRRAQDDHPALLFEESTWSWRQFVAESAIRSRLFLEWQTELREHIDQRPERFRQLHIGILLENVPEYLFTLCGAALCGVTVIGINPTRRGTELATDIRSVDCDVIITDAAGHALIDRLDIGIASPHIHTIDVPEWGQSLERHQCAVPELVGDATTPETLLALLFTSGSTGAPKAVMCSTGRLAMLGTINYRELVRDDVAYNAMPLFHGNALMASFAPSVYVGCTFSMRRKFSASGFLPDVLRFGATYVNYVGRSLSYVLAQPEVPEEKDTKLRVVFGTEASVHDRAEFARRFGVTPGESYGCSEGAVVISRTEDTPPNALGVAGTYMDIAILNEEGRECPRAVFDDNGGLVNAGEAIGEICNLGGAALFEGYYRNPEATAERNQGEIYRSGDLGYRDSDGFFYFAGRTGGRIRVDSENFSSGPVEQILDRYPGVLVVSVFPVPDPVTGDQVMAAIQLDHGTTFDPVAFGHFCRTQPDMGTKWTPSFVRIVEAMPVTATSKIATPRLKSQSWVEPGEVYLRDSDGEFRALTDKDRQALLSRFAHHGRSPSVGAAPG